MVRKVKNSSDTNTNKVVPSKKSISHNDDDDDNDSVDSYGNIRDLIDYDYDSNDETNNKKYRKSSLNAKKKIKEILKNENDIVEEKEYIEDDEDYDEDEEDEDEDEDEEDEEMEGVMPEIKINFGSFGFKSSSDRFIPKRYNLKNETVEVQKFVECLTKKSTPVTIDDQIDEFKKLNSEKQLNMIQTFEKQPKNTEQTLMFKILTMQLKPEILSMILSKYNSLQNMEQSTSEYYKLRTWLEKLTSIPFGLYKNLPANIDDGQEACSAFMMKAQKCLADAIYGQEEAKLQILQFIATKLVNPNSVGLSLLLIGPPGIGKTSLIKNGIAKALDWPFEFISLGGDSDSTSYTGHQVVYEGSHCGKIVSSLVSAKVMSMILMFDELDKISTTPKGEEVQNMLIHLTDPVQNNGFEDKYFSGIPIDLSKVMFVFSGNNIEKIDKILLDRMIVIKLQGYNLKEKIIIGEKYILPNALKEVNLCEKVSFSREIIEYILIKYTKEEPGVREFKRSIEQVIQKINMLRIYNSKNMPFYIPNFSLPFIIKKEHIDLFLKKQSSDDVSYLKMYS